MSKTKQMNATKHELGDIVDQAALDRTIARCKKQNILLPTFEQLAHPELIPKSVKDELKRVGMNEVHPRNLFRITWKNEPVEHGGGYGGVNYIELPSKLTGVKCKIYALVGKHFPTGAHKVGATYGPLVSRMVRGAFDPEHHKALWPSTGNYCRGGTFNSALLGVEAIAVLPEGMSKERFEWLKEMGAEIHATPGCESNVKEVFDKARALHDANPDQVVVLNQFQEFSNPLFHYYCTGQAMEEVFEENKKKHGGSLRMAGVCLAQGSAGTLASADYMKTKYPTLKIGANEAVQCPTLLSNGYGDHRIEGIGDKHVPWIHNVKNTDVVVDVDDDVCMRMCRLFDEPAGQKHLIEVMGLDRDFVMNKLPLLGISGMCNVLGCIKMAKYFELDENDVMMTVATDSIEMYRSRLADLTKECGPYTPINAAVDTDRLQSVTTDNMLELRYVDRKRMHNLKYFTWVEQQGKAVARLNAQWYDNNYWTEKWSRTPILDELIKKFNKKTGVK